MEQRLKAYLKYMENLDFTDPPKGKEAALRDLLIQIEFFQHERHIHLLVTLAFAFFTMCMMLGAVFTQELPFILLALGFIIFDVFYIRHYFLLENGVQKLYGFYDRLRDGS